MRQADAAAHCGGEVAARLLAWYDVNARDLPWRIGPAESAKGRNPDPYLVWLSEVMLQQTTVATVAGYYNAFVSRWPTIADLAAASDDDVMRAWAGLGYYSRARNLIAAARQVAARGGFPDSAAELIKLPGIGRYTASAIAAIAFDRAEPVVDGNIERVIARLFAIDQPAPAAKKTINAVQATLTPGERPGDYAQAMMDLGAMICTPKRPACDVCPLRGDCRAAADGNAEAYPIRAPKAARPTRYGTAYVAVREDGAILLRKRAPSGLLGGMAEVPGSIWSEDRADAAGAAPLDLDWRAAPGPVIHVFTHFRLELEVLTADAGMASLPPAGHWWSAAANVHEEALPNVMKKAIEAARPGATRHARPRLRARAERSRAADRSAA